MKTCTFCKTEPTENADGICDNCHYNRGTKPKLHTETCITMPIDDDIGFNVFIGNPDGTWSQQ